MAAECSPLSWGYCYQEEGMEELKHTLLFTTLELEKTRISAKEEITRRECELIHVKDVLSKVMKERDEAQGRCQKLMSEKLKLQQEIAPFSGFSSSEDRCYSDSSISVRYEYIFNIGLFNFLKVFLKKSLENHILPITEYSSKSRSNTVENDSKPGESKEQISSPESNKTLVSSPGLEPSESPPLQLPKEALKLTAKRQLPEKGKLLQAVKDAGPLLQNLLLAGPLPQWQHPPPQLTSIDIPPVAISSSTRQLNGCLRKKRGPEMHESASDSSHNTKNQKVV